MLERDPQRLAGACARTNLSAQGGAAMARTSWPIDRRRVAELLGHEGLVVNAADAGGFAREHLEEGVACLALLMSGLGRLATDLCVGHTWECGFVEVADALAGTSSIMPQKKHTHAFGDDILTPMGDASTGALRLLTEAIGSLTVHRDVMAAKAGTSWSTTSHLADELVRRFDWPVRAAHQIVGRFVRDAVAAGQSPATVTPDLIARAAREEAGAVAGAGGGAGPWPPAARGAPAPSTSALAEEREAVAGRHGVELEVAASSAARSQSPTSAEPSTVPIA